MHGLNCDQPKAVKRGTIALLAAMTLASCAPTLLHGRFAQTVAEDEMTKLAVVEDATGGSDSSVTFIQIPLPDGWQKAMWGWNRGPLNMPPELQQANLAKIKAQCQLEPVGVVRLHGGAGGGWPRYERILRHTARANGGSIVVLTAQVVELVGKSTATNYLVAAVTFSGDTAQTGCLYERLGKPIVRHSLGNLGCTKAKKPGSSPAFCPSTSPVKP